MPNSDVCVLVIGELEGRGHYYEHLLRPDTETSYRVLETIYRTESSLTSHAQPLDGILLDMPLSYFDCQTVLYKVRSQLGGTACPPVIIIGEADVSTAMQAVKAGAADYLVREQLTSEALCLALRTAITNAELKRELQYREEQFHVSVENMQDCFGIYSAIRDESGEIIDFRIDYVNDAACRNNQRTREQQVGRRLCEVLPGHRESGLFDEYCRLVETGEPLVKESLIYEDVFDGRRLVRAFDIRASKLNESFVASWRDITEQKLLDLELSQTVSLLQHNQERLKLAMQAGGIGTWDWNLQTQEVHWSDNLQQLFGLEPGHFDGQIETVMAMIHPDDHQRVQLSLQQTIEEQANYRLEFRFIKPDGNIRWALSLGRVFYDAAGTPLMMSGVDMDITERKQMELELQEANRQLEAALVAGSVYTWLWDMPTNQVTVNRSCAHLFGLETSNPTLTLPLEPFLEAIHPADRESVTAAIENAIVHRAVYMQEFRVCDRAGDEHWVVARGRVEFDVAGMPETFRGTLADITERKQSAAAQQHSEATLQALIAASPIGLALFDRELRFLQANEALAQLNDLPLSEHIGRSLWEVLPDRAPDFAPQLQQVMETQEAVLNLEFEGEVRPGVYRHTIANHFPVCLPTGEVIGVGVTALDISELRQTERALQQATERLDMALKSAPIVLFNHDRDLRYTWVYKPTPHNPVEAILGKRDEDLADADSARRLTQLKQQVLDTGVGLREEVPVTIQGQTIFFDLTIEPLWDEQQALIGITCAAVDITQRVQLEADRQQAQTELAANEARLRGFVESNIIGIHFSDIYGGITEANDEFLRMIGYTRADLQAGRLRWDDLTPSEYLPLDAEKIVEAREQGACTPYEKEYLCQDGTGVPVLMAYSLVGEAREEAVAFVLDLSNRKQAERRLQESEERLRLGMLVAGFALAEIDYSTNTVHLSPEAAVLYGLPTDQLIISREQFHATWHPEERAQLEQRIQAVLTPVGADHFAQDHRIVWNTGEVKWLSICKQVFFDQSTSPPRPSHALLVALDITDRKQAETALQQSEDRLRLAIESSSLGTWDWHLVTNELVWDAGCKAMFGLSPADEPTIDLFFEALHPDDRPQLEQIVQQVLAPSGSDIHDAEYRIIRSQDPVERWIKATGQRYFDHDGRPLRFVGVVLDITEQKQIEAQRAQLLQREQAAREAAERANRIKDEFLAILSHELRSPLNPILGWANLLQTKKMSAEVTTRALETIERNAKLQTQLIDDLLDVARILRGKLKLEMNAVDLVFVVEAAIETVQPAAAAKAISIQTDLQQVGQVYGDAGRLQQIVWNLLTNAIKFTPEGRQVEVQLVAIDDVAHIQVTDTGIGIRPEFLPYIFESFRQDDTSVTRQYGGLGLGLAIVRYLVEAHGGTITADSPGANQGATFTVKLPLLPSAVNPTATPRAATTAVDLTGLQVWVVDDSPDTLELLSISLEAYGAEVRVFDQAAKVLENLAANRPDILLCDIGMPKMDGYTLIRQIRSLPSDSANVPAIALTAYVRDEERQKALSQGFQRHLAKPFEPSQLAIAIAEICLENR